MKFVFECGDVHGVECGHDVPRCDAVERGFDMKCDVSVCVMWCDVNFAISDM